MKRSGDIFGLFLINTNLSFHKKHQMVSLHSRCTTTSMGNEGSKEILTF